MTARAVRRLSGYMRAAIEMQLLVVRARGGFMDEHMAADCGIGSVYIVIVIAGNIAIQRNARTVYRWYLYWLSGVDTFKASMKAYRFGLSNMHIKT